VADVLARLQLALADRYAIERELGRGGMATVYLARDLKHHRQVAIKVLKPELAAALGPSRFLREIEIAAQLTHPHILPLYDSGEAPNGLLYYVMPYVQGESLRARLDRERQLPLDDALQITREVADALNHAHSVGIIHRDIKPENILFEAGHAVVSDFGIARAITAAGGETLTETGIAVGTPTYMSPEQASAEHLIDGRTDVYSLGCVLYEMLAGTPPFTGPSGHAILVRKSVDPVPSLRAVRETVPVGIEHAVNNALARVPADRFATVARFVDALEQANRIDVSTLGESVVRSAKTPTLRARRLLAGSRRWTVPVGVTAAVVIVGALGRAILARRNGAADTGATSRVVVMPFENRTAIAELEPLGVMVAEWVTQGLTEAPFLTVLDTRSAPAAPATVGRETGAGVVVEGSYFLQGDSLQFQARISSTADGSILFAIGGVTAPRDRPLEGAERLRQRVLAAFASLHDKDVSTFQTALALPPTYAAYREYVEGLESYMGGGEYRESARRFLQAAVLDSTFLTARVWAAQAGVLAGTTRMDEAWARRADSLISGLQLLRDRMAVFDRARLDFVVALRAGELFDQYRATLRLVDASPGSVDARREAALTALRILHPREGLRRLEELDPARGLLGEWGDSYWAAVAWANHLLGRHEDELTAVRRGRQLYPSNPVLLYLELRALAALGRTAELDSMARVELPASGQTGLIAFGIAGELMAHGHRESAQRLARHASDHPGPPPPSEQAAAREWLEQHIELRREVGDPLCYLGGHLERRSPAERARDEWLHWRAELALLVGDVETAASYAAQLHDPDAHGLLDARVLAAQGKRDAARAALEQRDERRLQARGTLRGLEIDRASVLVRLGDLQEALEVLSEGLRRGAIPNTHWGQDGHAYPDLAPLWGDPRFRALIKPRG
jgi:tRNA A-37 threonylcarbamoyl transferase component Bud32/tetratricopeptide (TPR) repeat protein